MNEKTTGAGAPDGDEVDDDARRRRSS